MAYPPTCLSCRRAFPANPTLATLPHAGRVGIDPARQRVWRICGGCGEWNLLGAEDARVVIPELSALLAGAPLRSVDLGIELAQLPGLDIVQVELEPGEALDAAVGARQDALLARQDRLARIAAGFGLVAIAWLLINLLVPGLMPGTTLLAIGLPIWSAQLVALAYQRWRLGAGSVRRPLVASGLLLGIGLAFGILAGPRQAASSLLGWPFIAGAMIWINTGMPVGWIRLPSGRRVIITRRVLDLTRLWLDGSGSLRVTLPNGTVLDHPDGDALLRGLLDGYSWETAGEAQVTGLQLARGSDPLPRILELLRPVLDGEPGGLPLGRLPAAWRAGLDLALAASGGAPGRLSELAEKAREAQHVAAIAESLDHDAPG